MPSSRSRATVLICAISLRNWRSFFTPSFCPSATWKRILKSCFEEVVSWCLTLRRSNCESLSVPSSLSWLQLSAFLRNFGGGLLGSGTLHKLGSQRELVRRQPHGL